MSLKSLHEFSDDSNTFERRIEALRLGKASEVETAEASDELLAWLRTCIAHGCYLSALSPEREALQGLVDYWTTRLLRLGRAVPADIERLVDFDPTAGIPLVAECPYPGLDPYTDKQRGSFFGREAQVTTYIAHLEDSAKRILLIIGASGSGKSSLVLAGVLPKLEESHRDDWLFAPRLTPGDHPLAALATAVARAIDDAMPALEIERRLRAMPSAALSEFAGLCNGKPLLLVIDQFEELFTLCRDPEEQKAFGAALCALSAPSGLVGSFACRILLTLRTDHLARFESSEILKPLHGRLLGQGNDRYLSAVGFLEIKRAIAEPAKRIGLRFCPAGLIDQLASQTAGLANGLPLLQFALRRLWDTRPRNADGEPLDLITEEQVNALPDVQRALGRVADGIFRQFTPAQQQVCERLLQELVVLDENFEEPLRRRRNEAELTQVLQSRLPVAQSDVVTVIEQFANAGLLRRFGDGSQRQIEVAHEALLRHWEHINRLVTGERVKEQLHLVKQVGREAAEWVARGRPESYLNLRGDRLERALEYARDGWLAEAESTQYVEACEARQNAEEARERQAEEAKRRADEAEKAVKKAALEKAEAEKREAEARAREAKLIAKRKTAQLWLGVAFGIVVVGGLLALNTITDQRRNLESSLNAFSTLAASLPPWEGLDVAYSLAQRGDSSSRFPLAHALERMDDTWLLGEQRNVGLNPNQDGTALVQLDRTRGSEALRIYLIARGKPGSTVGTIPVGNRIDLLADYEVGPPIDGNNGDRLAVLVLRDATDTDYTVEAHHLRLDGAAGQQADVSASSTLDKARALAGIGFDVQGKQAVFGAVDRTRKSMIYRIRLDPSGKPEMLQLDDPAGPGAFPVNAVAFGAGAASAEAALITGRADGSVYCGSRKLEPKNAPATPASGPVQQIVGLAESEAFAMVDSMGAIYGWSCADGELRQFQTDGTVSGVTLTSMPDEQGKLPLLGYLDDNQPRCFALREKRWSYRRCNLSHRVSASIPLPDGRNLTVELSHVPAVALYPSEIPARQFLKYQARRAGSTVVRWESPTSAAEQFRKDYALRSASGADLPAGEDLPWQRQGDEWVANAKSALVIFAALSRDGTRLAWMEQLRPDEAGIVARTWEIGGAKPPQVPKQFGQVVSVAITNEGMLAHGQVRDGQPVELHLDGSRIDALDANDETACLAFSPDGSWLVAGGVPGGAVRAYRIQRPTIGIVTAAPSGPWEKPFDEMKDQRPRPIAACDISNDGAVVVGTDEGRVKFRRPGGAWLDLTERATFRLAASVQDVAIDRTGQHVLALAAWQLTDCSRPGLPGQALRVWDVTPRNQNWSIPISTVCLPNQVVVGVGELTADARGEPGVMLVTARGTRWHACPGCARPDETPDAMLARLMDSARESGAQPLSNDALANRYGLKF
jgi:hypothetical protein